MDKEKEKMETLEEKKVEVPKKKNKEEKKDKKLEKELEKLREENRLKDEKILRISAEMQNMKRRSDEEREKILKYDGEELILKILPILDNFQHAISMDDNNLSDELSKFLSGFKMIYGNLTDILKSMEVKEIDCLHQAFDEASMNAVLVDSDKDYDNHIVLDVLQKGYIYKDKVIRPAMVKVNNKESE